MADQKSNLTPGGPIHEKPKGFPIFGSGARAEDQLRLLIESAKDYAIFTLDKDRKVTSWSSGAQTILGYTEEEIIGQSGDVIFIPEDRDINGPEEELKTAAEKGRAENERLHLRKDGSRFWGSGVTHPLRDEEGNLVGFVKIMRDLTTAKRLEEAKFFLASIVETSNDSVITIDFQRNITSWNKAAEYLYRYSAQEAIGKNLTMLTLPEDFAALLANVDAVEHSRQVVVFDTVRHKKDGQLIDLEIVMSPVLNTSGELIGISTIARDVSERKRREANLAFLAKINLGFAPLLTIEEVMEPVASQLADYLHLHRCHFSLIDEEADRVEVIYEYRRDESLPSIKWVQHISDKFTQEGRRHLSAGQLVVMDEVPDSPLVKGGAETLKALHFGSLVFLPHLEAGRWRFLLTAGRVDRSQWRTDELELLQELSSKIYIRIERARAEEALRQSEERLQSITNLVPDLLWDSEPDGSTNWYNQRWLEYTGQSLEEAIGWGWMDAIHPDDRETSVRNYYKAVKNGEILRQEHRIRRHDGEYRWFIVSAYPSKNESGQLMKMYGAATDIHELRLVNAALRQSETRLRTLADVVPQVIWTNTSDGIADYFNQRWYEFTGLTYEQSKGPGWQTIVHPDDAPASIEKWKKALVAGEVFDTEYRLRRHDGIYCWFIGRNAPLKDGAGKIIGWFGSATDIENLKKTEAALSQSEAKLRITLESATDYAIITMDTNRKVEQWSQGATHLFGYTEEEMIGQTADTIFTEEDQEAGAQQHEMETARNTGRAADERWHRRKDGSRFFASGVMRSIVNNGVLTGYVKVLRDVTQQKLFTEELHRLVAERTVELQRSNEDLRQFAHVASHDLKEPIRKIQTFNNRILDEYANELPPRVKTFSEKIGASADRMISIIEGVLRYSKLGNAEQVMEEVNLGEVIEQISADLEVLIQQKDALVTTTNLPTLMANPTLMYQLFYNLILNSLKFAKEDEAPRINITSEKVQQLEKDFVSITVSDNGIGFEQEFSQDIFKTFSRLHPAEDYEGTGLGLALCKKIVERHGGNITASGEPEKGATFNILLPFKTQ